MNEKDNIELYETIERDLQDTLMRMEPGDPNRKPVKDELQTISNIRIAYQDAEQRRLDSYAKNENDEERLVVEKQRYEADKIYKLLSIGVSAASPFAAGWIGWKLNKKSYQMDEDGYSYKPMKDLSKRIFEFFGFKR